MNLLQLLCTTCVLMPISAQAAVHGSASFDWSAVRIIQADGDVDASLEYNIAGPNSMNSTRHDLAIKGGFTCALGCYTNIAIDDPDFSTEEGLYSEKISASSTITHDMTETHVELDTSGFVSAVANGYARFTVSGQGTVTLRIPYMISIHKDESASLYSDTILAGVTLAEVAPSLGYTPIRSVSEDLKTSGPFANTAIYSSFLELSFLADGLAIHELTYKTETIGSLAPVPEPETYALLGIGFAGVAFAQKRRKLSTFSD